METLIINMLRLLCPYLIAMAKKTDTPLDDKVVQLICHMVATPKTKP